MLIKWGHYGQTLIRQIGLSLKQDPDLKSYQLKLFDFEVLLKNFFVTIDEKYKPFLIPPKRSIAFETNIVTNEEIATNGEGIINRLFYLKNQDFKSAEYKVYLSIYEEFERITSTNFNIMPKPNNKIELYYKNEKDDWIPAKNCGLGITDTLIIISLVLLTESNTFLIEEPENHLHAEYQKKLLYFFRRQEAKQFVLATHSNVILNPNMVDKIIHTEFIEHIKVSDVTSRSRIIASLGYSINDNLSSDLIILTEGPTDVPIIESILTWKGLNLKYNYKFWPLCGDMMNNLDLEMITENYMAVAIIDSDPKSQKVREDFKKKCSEYKIECWQLKRYSIEHYLSLNAIREVFVNQIPQEITSLNHKKSIKDQLGFNIKSKNYQIIKKMSLTDFQTTDLLDFCELIENLLNKVE